MMFANPEKAANAKEVFLADDEKRKVAMQMWDEKTVESNFALTKAMLEVSPAQMAVFAPRTKVLGLGILLMLKIVPATGGETGIFAFDTSTIRGFQMGDPAKKPKSISVRAFDTLLLIDVSPGHFEFVPIGGELQARLPRWRRVGQRLRNHPKYGIALFELPHLPPHDALNAKEIRKSNDCQRNQCECPVCDATILGSVHKME